MLQFNLYNIIIIITFNNIAVFIFICLNICINIITCALINYIMPGADSTKKNKAVKDRSGYVGLRTCTCSSYAVEQKSRQAATWIYLAYIFNAKHQTRNCYLSYHFVPNLIFILFSYI